VTCRNKPLVSIGMPVYNGEKFIREALDSLLAQTFTDFELIISDNASTDNTEAICLEYAAKDARIRYVRQPENRGVLFNFQFVLDEARGEYFMWSAHDDAWDNRWLEVLLPVSSVHQCLAYGFVQTIDANSKKMVHPANSRKFDFTGNRFFRRLRYFMEPGFLGKANPIYGIFPITVLREVNLSVLESEKKGGDMILLYILLDRMEIRQGVAVFLYKRVHDDCVGGGVTQVTETPDFISKLMAFLRGLMNEAMLCQYITRSSMIQSAFLVAAYPVCVARAATYALFYKLRRVQYHRNS
jgi:glycosyltransferase involved in cell wall biosynthesis